jgi:hypothetical protein
MEKTMTHVEANQLAERGLTVSDNLLYATARKGPFTYGVSYIEGANLPWRFTMKGPKIHNVKTWDFSHFWKILNHMEKFYIL